MFSARSIRVLLALSFSFGFSASTQAQCLDWRAVPERGANTAQVVAGFAVFDAGSGPLLYVRGALSSVANPAVAKPVLTWDGQAFHDVPEIGGAVHDLIVYDDGSGSALYVLGNLTLNSVSVGGIARWNGSTWSIPGGGTNGTLTAAAAFDDGTGTALFVAGAVTLAGSNPINRFAKWDGLAWSAIPTLPVTGTPRSLAVYDHGTGAQLYAGGDFLGLYSRQASTWTVVPGSTGTRNMAHMSVFDDGLGPVLYVRIDPWPGGVNLNVWSWNGVQFGNPPGTPYGGVSDLQTLDLGTGARLFAVVDGSLKIWDGVAWTTMPSLTPGTLQSVTVFDSGSGLRLVAGTPNHAFGVGVIAGEWDGSAWLPMSPPHQGFSGLIRVLEQLDFGTGPRLYAGGTFTAVDGLYSRQVVYWDGFQWQLLTGFQYGGAVTAMAKFNQKLIVARLVDSQQTLTGAVVWSLPQSAVTPTKIETGSGSDSIFALKEYAGVMWVGGVFTHFGGVATPNLAGFTGSGVVTTGAGMNGAVNALEVFDDGSGPGLYAAGTFTSANGVPANRIARWNGSTWTPLGSGLNGLCDALVAFDDGTGPALYAAGTFTTAGGIPASCVAKWQNGAWSALNLGLNAQVLKLSTFDDGSGPALYAGGNFTASGGKPIDRIARWDGFDWSAVGAGVDGTVWAMQSFNGGNGGGTELFVGGSFHNASNQDSDYLAAWRACSGPIARFCFGDGTVAPCPCGNQGLAARGCDNSLATGGARMNAGGTTSPDTIAFYLAGLIPGTAAMLFQGNSALSAPLPLGDGLLCAGGSIRRLEVAFSSGGTLAFPSFGGPSISAQSAAAGDPLVPGNVRGYQAWYRDSNPSFCTPATSNVSNAVRVVW